MYSTRFNMWRVFLSLTIAGGLELSGLKRSLLTLTILWFFSCRKSLIKLKKIINYNIFCVKDVCKCSSTCCIQCSHDEFLGTSVVPRILFCVVNIYRIGHFINFKKYVGL